MKIGVCETCHYAFKLVNLSNSVINRLLYTTDKKANEPLKKLFCYILQAYAHAWFEIKASSKLYDSSKILFDTILQLQNFQMKTSKKLPSQEIMCAFSGIILYCLKKGSSLVHQSGFKLIAKLRKSTIDISNNFPESFRMIFSSFHYLYNEIKVLKFYVFA